MGPVVEEKLPISVAFDSLQELLGDDLVGVDIGPVEGEHWAANHIHRLHLSSQSLTSTKWPATAAAAAIAGLTRWVLAPRPWRPS